WPEGPGHHQVAGVAPARVTSGTFGRRGDNLHPFTETQVVGRVQQERRTPILHVDEHPARARPPPGEGETGNPPAAAEVDRPGRGRDGGMVGPGVGQVVLDRAGTEEAEPASSFELGAQRAVRVAQDGSAGGAGRITTRRWGSSPSDVVCTPSISFTTSWTTLRSAGCIGSSARATPVASTSAATWRVNRSSASRRRCR